MQSYKTNTDSLMATDPISPDWLVETVQSIQVKYPNSSFMAHGDEKVKCLDCDGRL